MHTIFFRLVQKQLVVGKHLAERQKTHELCTDPIINFGGRDIDGTSLRAQTILKVTIRRDITPRGVTTTQEESLCTAHTH